MASVYFEEHPCPVPRSIRKKVRRIMFGLVMVFVLALITVVPPFAVMAVARDKNRRR
jgi:hypothetical protein